MMQPNSPSSGMDSDTASARHMKPGDEAPAGTPGTGENLCPECSGTGRAGKRECATCEGTGTIIQGVGGA